MKYLKNINEWIGVHVSWFTTALVILIFYDVMMRYLFSKSAAWVGELEWHLFAIIFLLGAGYTFKHDRHVRVDLFYQNFSKKRKAWVNLVGTVIFLVPWCVMIILSSFRYTRTSFEYLERSQDPGGLPARYIIKGMITVGFILLLWQALLSIIEQIKILKSRVTSN